MLPTLNMSAESLEWSFDSIDKLHTKLKNNVLLCDQIEHEIANCGSDSKNSSKVEDLKKELIGQQYRQNELHTKLLKESATFRDIFLKNIYSQYTVLVNCANQIASNNFDDMGVDQNSRVTISGFSKLIKDINGSADRAQDIKYYQTELLTKYFPFSLWAVGESVLDKAKIKAAKTFNAVAEQLFELAIRSCYLVDKDLTQLFTSTYEKYANNEDMRTFVKDKISKIKKRRQSYQNIFSTQFLPLIQKLQEDLLDFRLQLITTRNRATLGQIEEILGEVNSIINKDFERYALPYYYVPGYNDIWLTANLGLKILNGFVLNDKIKMTALSLLLRLHIFNNSEMRLQDKADGPNGLTEQVCISLPHSSSSTSLLTNPNISTSSLESVSFTSVESKETIQATNEPRGFVPLPNRKSVAVSAVDSSLLSPLFSSVSVGTMHEPLPPTIQSLNRGSRQMPGSVDANAKESKPPSSKLDFFGMYEESDIVEADAEISRICVYARSENTTTLATGGVCIPNAVACFFTPPETPKKALVAGNTNPSLISTPEAITDFPPATKSISEERVVERILTDNSMECQALLSWPSMFSSANSCSSIQTESVTAATCSSAPAAISIDSQTKSALSSVSNNKLVTSRSLYLG